MTGLVEIRAGAVYLPADLAEVYFRDIAAVVVLIRQHCALVLPVRQAAAGGYLLKQRNAAGDRVVHAPDVFAASGLDT